MTEMMDQSEDLPPLIDNNEMDHKDEKPQENNPPEAQNNCSQEDMSDEDDDETQWKEIEKEESNEEKSLCFFCNETYNSPCTLFSHMEVTHQFSMKSMACHWSFDQLTYIKYVNYLRKEKPRPPFALSMKPANFNNTEYMKPVIENDPLLMFGNILLFIFLFLLIQCNFFVDVEEFHEYSEDSEDEVASLRERCDELEDMVQKQKEALNRLIEESNGGRELKVNKNFKFNQYLLLYLINHFFRL